MCFITMDLEPDETPELTTESNPLSAIDDIDSFVEQSFETIITNLSNNEKQAVGKSLPLANNWIN